MALLTVSGLTLSFGGIRVLDGIDFCVEENELFAIIGPNGAGKTSIFNCINGVYRPQTGTIQFAGNDIVGKRPHRIAKSGIGRVFQNVELFANLTVADNLMLGRHHLMHRGLVANGFWLGPTRREEVVNRRAVEETIEFLEIEPYRNSRVGMLPYGLQKRVELGRALCGEPQLLLLDEPVAGMNSDETEDMARFILDVQQELKLAMILVEHDMGLVMDIADRVLALDFGEVIATGEPAAVQADPEVIRAYLGEHVAAEDRAGDPT